MNAFFQTRMHAHQKRIQRYLKYVFNDHFALLMTFLLGAAGLSYSNWLKSIDASFIYGKWLLVIVWGLAVTMGRFASLTQPADQVFLLPKEAQMRSYLTSARRYSYYLPMGVAVLIIGAGMPLYVVVTQKSFWLFFLFLLLFGLLKGSQLYLQQLLFFQGTNQLHKTLAVAFWLFNFLAWLTAIFVTPFVGVLLAGFFFLFIVQRTWVRLNAPLDWEILIATEQKRLYRMYRFINLFTDVPQITATVKRRKYADPLLRWIPRDQKHTYTYLYLRRLIRGTEYSGLVIRLLFLGGLSLWFVDEWWLILLVSIVWLYLIGFQLFPLAQQFQYLSLAQMYPITRKTQLQSFQKVVGATLLVATFILGIIGGFNELTGLSRMGIWLGMLSFDGFFCYLYLPMRLTKRLQPIQ